MLDLVAAETGPRAQATSSPGADVPRSALGDAGEILDAQTTRQAIARIGEHHPQLSDHLSRTIRTGTYCAYFPGPRAPAGWRS